MIRRLTSLYTLSSKNAATAWELLNQRSISVYLDNSKANIPTPDESAPAMDNIRNQA